MQHIRCDAATDVDIALYNMFRDLKSETDMNMKNTPSWVCRLQHEQWPQQGGVHWRVSWTDQIFAALSHLSSIREIAVE